MGVVDTSGAGARPFPERPSALSAMNPESLAPLWTSVLLNIHRGGRKKLAALRQISDAIKQNPASAERLLPVLAVAIRSVRAPESRAGLSAILSTLTARPELKPLIGRELPELQVVEEVAVI